MGFSEIRKALESKNIEEAQIKAIIRTIDNKVLGEATEKSKNLKAKEIIYLGLFITVVGIFITIATYTGMINMGDSFLLAYGPILGGIAILLTGLAKYQK